jgi:hypothetical protein
MSKRISLDDDPRAAAMCMQPQLAVQSSRVRADVDVIMKSALSIGSIRVWTRQVSLPKE